jgi:hypothetical protein
MEGRVSSIAASLPSASPLVIEEKLLRAAASASSAEYDLWPIRLKPLPDEIISSWLMRLAMAHGVKLHTFSTATWPQKAVWNRDIDKSADEEVVRVLAGKSATPLERARNTVLSAYEGQLFESYNYYGPTPWLLPVGVYHRVRQRYGQQFCPHCLAEDKEPYYRRRWRLAFMICCERHRATLCDRCPRCTSPVNFHRNELGDFSQPVAVSMTNCHACGLDFRSSEARAASAEASPAEVTFTRRLLKGLEDGHVRVSDGVIVYSHLFFAGLRQLMKTLSLPDRRVASLRRDLQASFGVEIEMAGRSDRSDSSRNVEEWELDRRRQFLNAARLLLSDWPARFVEFSVRHQVWSSLWLKHLESAGHLWGRGQRVAPFWLWKIVNEELQRPRYQPSAQEIRSATEYLKRTRGRCSKKMLAAFFGMAVAYRRTPRAAAR